MTKKCDRCGINDGTLILQKRINGEVSREILCQSCANEHQRNNRKSSPNSFMQLFENLLNGGDEQEESTKPQRQATGTRVQRRNGVLDRFCRNLNVEAENGRIDPITGRNEEIDRVIHILNRRTKNNPVLIGEPGVGKTAIAEGLALRITEGNVPAKFIHKQIMSLDIAAVTAGTTFRGMFEERMKKIIEEAEKREDIILFIDELHMIIGAGSALESNMDAANILKPSLASGKIQVIGATTLDEYREIEKDAALERRFQSVKINEPNVEDTISILRNLQKHYEEYHRITYSDEAIVACAKLADRYISERFMPDKAIDLLDEVGSRMNLNGSSLTAEEEAELENINRLEQQYASEQNYEKAAYYKHKRAQLLENKESIVVKSDVERILENMTGIPVTRLAEDEKVGLSHLEERLNKAVIGQPNAVNEVVRAVQRNRFNLRNKKKPTVLFFAGPTGVGKTELTKQLTKELFGDARDVIRYDMSEFKESHAISKLIGSPPGYVGHEKGGALTEKVRRKPYSVILLDEFEKAHNEIQHLFLQVFDEGRLTDSQDKTVDFSNTVIIMTSNLGSKAPKKTGFLAEDTAEYYTGAIERAFAPEFINRLDAIVTFNHLKQTDLLHIIDLMLSDLIHNLKEEKHITLTVSDEAKKWLCEKGYDEKFGARPLSRVITKYIDDNITQLLLTLGENSLDTVEIGVGDNNITTTVS